MRPATVSRTGARMLKTFSNAVPTVACKLASCWLKVMSRAGDSASTKGVTADSRRCGRLISVSAKVPRPGNTRSVIRPAIAPRPAPMLLATARRGAAADERDLLALARPLPRLLVAVWMGAAMALIVAASVVASVCRVLIVAMRGERVAFNEPARLVSVLASWLAAAVSAAAAPLGDAIFLGNPLLGPFV